MRRLLWVYLRAWLWSQWVGLPQAPQLFWGFIGLAGLCAGCLLLRQELWTTPATAVPVALTGLLGAQVGAGWVLLLKLGQWWTAGWRAWQKLLLLPILAPALLAVVAGATLVTLAVAHVAGR